MKLAKKCGNFIHSGVQYLQSLMNRRGNYNQKPLVAVPLAAFFRFLMNPIVKARYNQGAIAGKEN